MTPFEPPHMLKTLPYSYPTVIPKLGKLGIEPQWSMPAGLPTGIVWGKESPQQ